MVMEFSKLSKTTKCMIESPAQKTGFFENFPFF